MTVLELGELKKLIENLPDEYTIAFKNEKTTKPISSIVEIDTSKKEVIFK